MSCYCRLCLVLSDLERPQHHRSIALFEQELHLDPEVVRPVLRTLEDYDPTYWMNRLEDRTVEDVNFGSDV